MLHIVWLILKIIGIILLIILGLLVLSVCAALFGPVRYKGRAKAFGTADSIEARFQFSWMLHLASGYVTFVNKEVKWQMRILWKKMNVPKKALEEEKPKVPEKKEKKKKYTFQDICDNIKSLPDFVADEKNHLAWKRLKLEFARLVKFLRPKKMILNAHFGFDDPAKTGQVLAGLSVLYPFYFEYINIEPEFNEEVLEGSALIKGNIRGIHLLIVVCNLIFDKNVKRAYKEIKKWKK